MLGLHQIRYNYFAMNEMSDTIVATTAGDAVAGERWLLLLHQLPSKPAYLRVKIWRRLQGLGAIALKNSVYALPLNEQTHEDFRWLLREIVEGGGDASICEARFIDGLEDDQIRALFDAAREAEYDAIAEEARAMTDAFDRSGIAGDATEYAARIARLHRRTKEVAALDFFGASGRLRAEAAISSLERRLSKPAASTPAPSSNADALRGKIWVTRRGVHVDRIACAWLVRRFIDATAPFKFVQGRGYAPAPGEIRFDMFDAEITHEGDRCSFEVLIERAGLADAALQAIAEIVHDIDLKDGKFGREETVGIAHVIAGIALSHREDEARIERGAAVLDDLYEYLRRQRDI